MNEQGSNYSKLTDRELVEKVCDEVHTAAILSSRGYGFNEHDAACRALLTEADRRGKPELYDTGYRMAAKSFGFDG